MRTTLSGLVVLIFGGFTWSQEELLPPPDRTPVLRLTHPVTQAPVTALAFTSDGGSLLVGGLEKLVRQYSLQGEAIREVRQLRVPLGPANAGAVNAIAVSPDGRWIAVAGRAPMRTEAGFAWDGVVMDTRHLSPAMREDLGVIYLFDPGNPAGGKVLRGAAGEVRALAFATPSPAEGPVLVAASTERKRDGTSVGAVRAWDVATGKLLAERQDLPATPTRPGLAAWAGRENKGLQVAIAWPQEKSTPSDSLLIWDVEQKRTRREPDGQFNLPLALRTDAAGAEEIVSGGLWTDQGSHGRLVRRPLLPGRDEQAIPFRQPGRHYIPRAVAVVGDSLAVVLSVLTEPQPGKLVPAPPELHLLAADGTRRARIELSDLPARGLPVLAASPDGRFVAVAGFPDHRVEVYTTAALARGENDRRIIGGTSGGFSQVAFLTGNKLWLGSAGHSLDRGGIIFDPAIRKTTPNAGGNKPDILVTDLKPELKTDTRPAAVVLRQGDQEQVFALRGQERPTAAVYIPGGVAWNKAGGPLLVVAHTDSSNAVTLLTLFDARTGRRMRQLVGPEQPVQALTVSATRPLLAAIGDGRSVAVWSFKDLDQAIGGIESLQVTDDGKQVLVATPDAGGVLAVGTIIEAVSARKGKPQPVKSAAEFLWAVRALPVGSEATLQVRGREQPVTVRVGRAVEQRGPLLTLWVGEQAGAEWVGWSPVGPYDAGSPEAESRIGWLTPTGQPKSPVIFAGADQYRKRYYRRDIVRLLLEEGELDAALNHFPLLGPRIWADIEGTPQRLGALALVRDKGVSLRVGFLELTDQFLFGGAVIRWRATPAGGLPGPWQEVALRAAEAPIALPLADYPWTRGRHLFEVALHRTLTSAAIDLVPVEVVYLPPAPRLRTLVDGQPVREGKFTTESDKIRLTAQVEPAPGTEVEVTVHWTDPRGDQHDTKLEAKADGTWAPLAVTLRPGVTRLRVTATTRGAKELARFESTTAQFEVLSRPPKKVVSPRLGPMSLTPPGETRMIDARPVVIADRASVRVSVPLEGEGVPAVVEWDEGNGKWIAAERAEGQPPVYTRDIPLPRGERRLLRFRAKFATSDFTTTVAEVVYHPPLRKVELGPLPSGEVVTRADFTLDGTAQAADEPVQVTVTVTGPSGQPRTFSASVEAKSGRWSARLHLEPGVNRIGLRIANNWREETRSQVAMLTYRRPPRILAARPIEAGTQAVGTLRVAVHPDAPPPSDLLVQGQPLAADTVQVMSPLPGVLWWEMTARNVAVRLGNVWHDSLRVAVRNEDGASELVAVAVHRQQVEARPPVIALADGHQDRTTDQPRLPLRFTVTAESRLTRVEVWHAAGPGEPFVPAARFDPSRALEGAEGFRLTGSTEIELRPGINRIRLTAVSAGGEASVPFVVSYLPPAVQVQIDRVEEADSGHLLTRRSSAGAPDLYAEAESGFVRVRGQVVWSSADAPGLRDPGLSAILTVNGVSHLPVPLREAEGTTREFQARVFLNEPMNRVRVDLRAPGLTATLPQQMSGAEFQVRCRNPLRQQRLHVVIIGLGLPEERRAELAREVVKALGGQLPPDRSDSFEQGEFRIDAFEQAILYPPRVGEVDAGDVSAALAEVAREMRRLSAAERQGWLNDVVLVYYHGRDFVTEGRRCLHTTRSLNHLRGTVEAAVARFTIPVDSLPPTPGVPLLLLNVADPSLPKSELDRLRESPPLLRYAWKGEEARTRLLAALEHAVAVPATGQKTLGEVSRDVRARIAADPARATEPVELVPAELRRRVISARPR